MSHVLPYLLYVALGFAAGIVPDGVRPWLDPLRAGAAGACLLVFARRGLYPELSVRETPRRGAAFLAVLSGVAVALLWMPLAEIAPRLGGRGGFPADAAPVFWAARVLAFVVVIPFAEELFVRSFLPRWVDAPDGWRARAVGVFTPLSAAVSIAFFAGVHPEWLAALVTAALWTGLLAATRRVRDVVVAHVVANALLTAYVIATGDTAWW